MDTTRNSEQDHKAFYCAQVDLIDRIDARLLAIIQNDATFVRPSERRPGLETARDVLADVRRTMIVVSQMILPKESQQRAISPEGSQS